MPIDMRFHRPPYVLAHPADQAGCGHHRIMRPIEIMSRNGVMAGRYDSQIWPTEHLCKLAPDIIVWQRQHDQVQIEQMKRYREVMPQAFIVYEIDDAMSLVPTSSFHQPFIPATVDKAMAEAVKHCNCVTVTTTALARHMRSVCVDDVDIRIVPNMLGKEDFATAKAMRQMARRFHPKPRIGWGGGISHKGDLKIIEPLISEFADRVQWVFLGMMPETKAPVEFHMGVSPRDYLSELAKLDLDLMIAPLEDIEFNNCKSNLRLIEGGACLYPVIASNMPTYRDVNPPVFGYADQTAESWRRNIQKFLDTPPDQQAKFGESMRQWSERYYCMDTKAEERAMAWLPKKTKPYRPRRHTQPTNGVIVVCLEPTPDLQEIGKVVKSFAEATESTADILYLRPGTPISREQIGRLKARIAADKVASATPISNDGVFCGFPRRNTFSPMEGIHGPGVDHLCAQLFGEVREKILIPHPVGPMFMLSRCAIDMCGMPAFGSAGTEEAAMIEWGISCVSRGYENVVAIDMYAVATRPNPQLDLSPLIQRTQMRFPPPKLNPDPLAEIRTRLELAFHRDFYRVPLPKQSSTYTDWSRIFDTPSDRDHQQILFCCADLPVKPHFSVIADVDTGLQVWPHWEHVSTAETIGDLIAQAKHKASDWIVFASGEIPAHALFVVATEINAHPEAVMFYSDSDIKANGIRTNDGHDFKPNFDHELLLSRDYLTQFLVIRRDALDAPDVAGNLSEVSIYRYALSIIRRHRRDQIVHIPRVLCHLAPRPPQQQHHLAVQKARIAAEHAGAMGWPLSVTVHGRYPQYGAVIYKAPDPEPLVSIIIPTGGKLEMLGPCMATLLKITKYQNYEILIMDNNRSRKDTEYYLEKIADNPKVRVVKWEADYNWSALNNCAVDHVKGDYILFLNDDTRIFEPDWLGQMVGAAMRADVGAVGARLLYPHGAVQHVGVISNKGLCGHIHKGLPDGHQGYNGMSILSHEATAVTGACMLISRKLFDDAGRFYEDMPHNFNDVAFCLELRRRGLRNIVCMSAQIQHYEGVTRTNVMSDEGRILAVKEGKLLFDRYPEDDPYWNWNLMVQHQQNGLMVTGLNYDLLTWPPKAWPWRGNAWPIERVLVIGDDGEVVPVEEAAGNPVYEAIINGYQITVVRPPLENTPVWDIRDPMTARRTSDALGIHRIVVRSIVGGPAETLAFLTSLGTVVEYRPRNAEAVCPMGDFKPNGNPDCGSGWKRGACQKCVSEHGTPFGLISIKGWRDSWARFLREASAVTTTNAKANGHSFEELITFAKQEASHDNDGIQRPPAL